MTFAIIPAAGLSSRMGRAKLGLPLGDSTVLGRVIAALRNGGVEVVLVLVGPHVPELVSLAESAGAVSLLLAAPTLDMRETVQAGLRELHKRYQPGHDDLWFLVPGDCPIISSMTVCKLIESARNDQNHSIHVPTLNGRSGHPSVFFWSHVPDLLQLPPGSGIDVYVRKSVVRKVPCDDPGILLDLDTPADYDHFGTIQ